MCVIIIKPKGKTLSKETLRRCSAKNKDGAGLVVNGAHSEKGFFKFKSLWNQVQKYQDQDLIVHCRKASVGPVAKRFCHPFKVGNTFLFHNGTVKGMGGEFHSDTYRLALILNQKESDREKILQFLSGKTKSRFLLVSKTSMQKFGKWYKRDGLSFSNLHWKRKPEINFYIPENKPDYICWNCSDKTMPWKWFCSNCGVLLKDPYDQDICIWNA